MKVIYVALSGGVDSAVSALLLKKQGYQVFGIHMQNWDPEWAGERNRTGKLTGCGNGEALESAKDVAKTLQIPLKIYNFVPDYWEVVFKPYIQGLKENTTPNPDICCNQKIKFDKLISQLIKDFGDDVQLATGHYAQICKKGKLLCLNTVQHHKDQTYFLSTLSQEQLKRIVFPLSQLTSKKETIDLATKHGLNCWQKKESMGICFIGKKNMPFFLTNFIPPAPGEIIDISTNKILGKHEGLHLYTLNQRRQLGIGGAEQKYFVCHKDSLNNTLFLCPEKKKDIYMKKNLTTITNIHWITLPPSKNSKLRVKFRSTGSFITATIVENQPDLITFKHDPVTSTSPGQYLAIYSLKQCLGSGVIKTQKLTN